MQASDAESSGSLVVEARDIAKSYGERKIVDGLSLRVMRGDRLGIVGANGAGKSTLINLLMGRLAPDAGQVAMTGQVNECSHARSLSPHRRDHQHKTEFVRDRTRS